MDIPKFHKGGVLKNGDFDQHEVAVSLSPSRVLVRRSELEGLGHNGVREKYDCKNAEIVAVDDDVFDSASPSEKMNLLRSD